MKTIASIIFLFLFIPAMAQNSLYFVLQPCDLGVGLRYDRQVYSLGAYVSATQGAYRCNEVIRHRKVSGGILYRHLSLGLCVHDYGARELEYPARTFKPVSFEIGAKNSTKRFTAGVRFDFIKREGSWDFGIKL